jgi:primosomal protein N''
MRKRIAGGTSSIMNARQNMFRQQHWHLAERQRYLTDLEALADRLRADAVALSGEIEESGLGAESPAPRSAFVAPLVDRHEKLVRTIAELETQIAEARQAVATAQQEVKLVEGAAAYRGFTFEDRRVRRTRRSV